MERTITGTVGEVKGRTVNTKYGEKTVFDITIGSQKTSTFKSDIAEEANALKGSDVEATVRVEPREGYPDNYMLQGVKLVNAYPAATQPQTSTIPVTTATDEVRGKVRSLIAAQMAAAVYTSLPTNDRTRQAAISIAETMTDYALNGPKGQTLDEAIQEVGLAAAVAPAAEVTEDIPW